MPLSQSLIHNNTNNNDNDNHNTQELTANDRVNIVMWKLTQKFIEQWKERKEKMLENPNSEMKRNF